MPKPALKRKQIQAALIVGVSTVVAAVIATWNSSQPNFPTAPPTIASSSNDQRPSVIPGEVSDDHASAKATVQKTQSPSKRLMQSGGMPALRTETTDRGVNESQSTEPSSAPKGQSLDDQSVVPSIVGIYKISEGNPLQLQQSNLTLAIQFSETLGVEYATLIANTREGTIRKPIITVTLAPKFSFLSSLAYYA